MQLKIFGTVDANYEAQDANAKALLTGQLRRPAGKLCLHPGSSLLVGARRSCKAVRTLQANPRKTDRQKR